MLSLRFSGSRPLFHLASVAGFALIIGSSPALAENKETWRCNTTNGHFDTYALPIVTKDVVVSGRVTFHKADFGSVRQATAKIMLGSYRSNSGECNCAGLTLFAYEDPHVEGFFLDVSGKRHQLSVRQYDIPITFILTVKAGGKLTAQIGRETVDIMTTQLAHQDHDHVELSCSGSDVSFSNIEAQLPSS